MSGPTGRSFTGFGRNRGCLESVGRDYLFAILSPAPRFDTLPAEVVFSRLMTFRPRDD